MRSAQADSLPETLTFAEKVVMPQGAIFIRELLRRKQKEHPTEVRIGVNKDEVKENLRAALRAGVVAMQDLADFVDEVEGWGSQHIYLYDARAVTNLDIWKTERRLQRKIAKAGFSDAWEATGDPTFPDELVVGRVRYDGDSFELLWRKKDEHWWRSDTKDKPREEIDGDLYEFRAYRQELKRSVMRFVLFPVVGKAALFVQIPLGERHNSALDTAQVTLDGLFPFSSLRAADISTAVKVLDTRELDEAAGGKHGQIQAQNTKFEAEGATIEFDADPTVIAWKKVPAVRRVRLALQTSEFRGHGGKFVVSLRLGPGLKRDVVMSLSGKAGRVYLQAQMTSQEVWTILDRCSRPVA